MLIFKPGTMVRLLVTDALIDILGILIVPKVPPIVLAIPVKV